MAEDKKIRFKKSWTIEVIEYEDGSIDMNRNNEGFSVMELLGITSMVQNHLSQLMDSMRTKPDNLNVSSTNSPIIHNP